MNILIFKREIGQQKANYNNDDKALFNHIKTQVSKGNIHLGKD